jgi:hypothetical protein
MKIKAYFQNMKPANHGHNLDSNYDYKKKVTIFVESLKNKLFSS